MFDATVEAHRVPYDDSFRIADAATAPPDGTHIGKKKLRAEVRRIAAAQEVLYAHDRYAVLLVFQAMDAAGKDGTIRAVTRGVNPAGCHVVSFKKPSALELDHDFLWRTTKALPPRGKIGIFNRSQYEEVLVVRVHEKFLAAQNLPKEHHHDEIWSHRLASIRDQELHLARNGVVILKFFLNVSRATQRKRFLARLDNPDKNWKFSLRDVEESRFWPRYMQAYEQALNATSRPWAPWYVIPADDKPYMRYCVARTVAESIESLGYRYPEPDAEMLAKFDAIRAELAPDQEPRAEARDDN